MSMADDIFVRMCTKIIEQGTTTEGQRVRPHWADGSLAYTIKRFGVCNRYDLRKEFPALTLRPTALKSCMDEILWIYQRKSNNVRDLKPHIWDEWADETGSIGKAYGYQVAQVSHYVDGDFDQMDRVLKDLRDDPYSRRIMTNLYTFADLSQMNLYPCAYNVIYNAAHVPGEARPTLNMLLVQRSQDVLVANNWNVCQYALLLMMVAQVSDMVAGELVHMIADAHIYDRHVSIVRELIARPRFAAPQVSLNPKVTDFYDFTTDDLVVENYTHGPQVKDIPVAISRELMATRGKKGVGSPWMPSSPSHVTGPSAIGAVCSCATRRTCVASPRSRKDAPSSWVARPSRAFPRVRSRVVVTSSCHMIEATCAMGFPVRDRRARPATRSM